MIQGYPYLRNRQIDRQIDRQIRFDSIRLDWIGLDQIRLDQIRQIDIYRYLFIYIYITTSTSPLPHHKSSLRQPHNKPQAAPVHHLHKFIQRHLQGHWSLKRQPHWEIIKLWGQSLYELFLGTTPISDQGTISHQQCIGRFTSMKCQLNGHQNQLNRLFRLVVSIHADSTTIRHERCQPTGLYSQYTG